MNGRPDENDDGRVIADMHGVQKRSILIPDAVKERFENDFVKPSGSSDNSLSEDESKWYILGALKAGLLIWLVYAVCFGLFIFLLTFLFSR
ncbi:MAG: hypothetical protein K6G61_12975 [Solobacterium sp.]|nr:hypothetical protein [Solobacterium sp.]